MSKPVPKYPTKEERRAIAVAITAAHELTDKERLDALFTLFGGHYAFSPFFKVQDMMSDGRRGLDAFIAQNPSLMGIRENPCPSVFEQNDQEPTKGSTR
jgi:hypothetical protein